MEILLSLKDHFHAVDTEATVVVESKGKGTRSADLEGDLDTCAILRPGLSIFKPDSVDFTCTSCAFSHLRILGQGHPGSDLYL